MAGDGKKKRKSTKAELYELLMLLPDSLMALGGQLYFALSGKIRPPLTNITIDDEKVYKPVLHAISSMLVFKVLSAQTVVNARVKLDWIAVRPPTHPFDRTSKPAGCAGSVDGGS